MSSQPRARVSNEGARRRQERPVRQAQQLQQRTVPQKRLQQQSSGQENTGHMASKEEYNYLVYLREGYKAAALGYKLSGDRLKALSMLKISKQLGIMTKAVEEGRPVDLNGLPPKPPKFAPKPKPQLRMQQTQPRQLNQIDAAPTRQRYGPEVEAMERLSLGSASPVPSSSSAQNIPQQVSQGRAQALRATQDEDITRLFDAPTSASSVMEALQQRLEKYKSTQDSATAEGNASKARRLGRIVKQYETAIVAATKGLDFDYDSLPCPPGYPPIPTQSNRTIIKVEYQPSPARTPEPARRALEKPIRPKTELNARVDELTRKQNLLKKAAVAAKESDDKARALELFRLAKGLDPIIEAVKCGLPFDEASIPPQLNETLRSLE